ncbi:MAG: hypothetical protein Rhims3KO_36270 [Hyphomicrobiales bacterium]
MTQQALGAATGRTFQQIQKYERGTNRISASTLWLLAKALKVRVSFFYEGLDAFADPGSAIRERP